LWFAAVFAIAINVVACFSSKICGLVGGRGKITMQLILCFVIVYYSGAPVHKVGIFTWQFAMLFAISVFT
jgi:hypothetical protein